MLDHFMLNGNLLRNDRWECNQRKQNEIGIDLKNRLRELISPSVKLFSYRNRVARSLFTTPGKKQIAFIISQICLMICIIILLVNLPPIIFEILTAEDIIVLLTKITVLVVYIVVLGFLFFMMFVIWIDKIKKFKDKYCGIDISRFLVNKAALTVKEVKLEIREWRAKENTTDPEKKFEKDVCYFIPLHSESLFPEEEDDHNEQEDTNSQG